MPPIPSDLVRPRPAVVVNEAIRALVHRASGRPWRQAERALYGLLLEEWEQARRADELTIAA